LKNRLHPKQKVILRALVLCLVDEWTVGGDPTSDLKELGLDPELIEAELTNLYSQDFLKKPINTILKEPKTFREALVLTEKGERACNSFSLNQLKNLWKQWGEEGELD
jgi:hypothetical protein